MTNPNIRRSSEKGYRIERLASSILENEGYKILIQPENERYENRVVRTKIKQLEFINQSIEQKPNGAIIIHREYRSLSDNEKKELNKLKKLEKQKRDKRNKILKILGTSEIPEISRIEQLNWIDHNYLKRPQNVQFREKLRMILENEGVIYCAEGRDRKPEKDEIFQKGLLVVRESKKLIKEELKKRNLFELYTTEISIKKQGGGYTYLDYLCRKNKEYFIIDVKFKDKDSTSLNRFYVTNREVLNYNRLQKEGIVKVMILPIIGKRKKFQYSIFNWNDFIIPKTFDPHKKLKTTIRLKNFDLDNFTKISL